MTEYQIGKNRGTRLHLVTNMQRKAWNTSVCGGAVATYGQVWNEETHGAETCKKCLKGGTSFSSRNQPRPCGVCGRIFADSTRMDSTDQVCPQCYEVAGIENEHQDGGHRDEPCEECPMCAAAPQVQEPEPVAEEPQQCTAALCTPPNDYRACLLMMGHPSAHAYEPEYVAPLMPLHPPAMLSLEALHRAALANGGCDQVMRIIGSDALFCGVDGLCARCASRMAPPPPRAALVDETERLLDHMLTIAERLPAPAPAYQPSDGFAELREILAEGARVMDETDAILDRILGTAR